MAAARRRSFVGRSAELAVVSDVLAGRSHASVLYVHGPGGVGKTTLLRQIGATTEAAGRRVHRVDGREFAVPEIEPGGVLLVDEVDAVPGRRDEVLAAAMAGVPADSAIVLAGRRSPPVAWLADPGWREILRVVRLANFDEADARALLRNRGVPDAAHAGAVAFTHGHPLALALWADVAGSGPTLSADRAPEVLTVLLDALIGAVPSPAHRAALEALSQVAVVTEPLLAALLDLPDARDLFEWLRELSIVDSSTRGLCLHDVAREAVSRDLRWRHPPAHAQLHARARAYYDRQRPTDPATVFDAAFLHRDSPVVGPFLRHVTPGRSDDGLATGTVSAAELPRLLAAVAEHEGAAAADAVAGWAGAQPEALTAVRSAGGALTGWIAAPALDRATPADIARDPVAAAAWAHAGQAPPASGETVLLVRSWGDTVGHQEVSPVQVHVTLHLVRRYLTTPDLAQVYVWCADPRRWTAAMAYTDFQALPGGLFVHDWRAVPPVAWMSRLAGREHDGDAAAEPGPADLTRAEFAAAVRAALRDVTRPDRLGDAVLARSRLVRARLPMGATAVERGRAVRAVLVAAAQVLEASPRDRRVYRAVAHTYLHPAATQAAAAELLDLPTSTYRRHLTAGIDRLTELLWRDETG